MEEATDWGYVRQKGFRPKMLKGSDYFQRQKWVGGMKQGWRVVLEGRVVFEPVELVESEFGKGSPH